MIPITYLRSSGYGSHDMCEMKYFAEYILGWRGLAGKAADKGTVVHKVLEVYANCKKAHQNGESAFYDDELIHSFPASPSTEDSLDITTRSFDHYSKASSYLGWTKADFKECLKLVHKVLDTKFDPRNLTIVDAEPFFDISFDDDWAKYKYGDLEGQFAIKGTIDLITQVTPTTYEICDYKTGKRMNWATGEEYTYEKLFSNPQLRMYHYAAHKLYPNVDNILVTIHYIKDGGPFTIPLTRSDIPDTIEMIRSKFRKIQQTIKPRVTRSWKCTKFCHYGKTTFEGTSVKPIIETRSGQVCPMGTCMTKCEQLRYCFQHRGLDTIIANMSEPNYQLTKYNDPGKVEK